MTSMNCRFCDTPLRHSFCDLGMSPPSNSYLSADRLQGMERFYPLHAFACSECFLVQLGEFESPSEIFGDYAYFSSYSDTWLKHASDYATRMIAELRLGPQSKVIEIASNDGYLLQNFVAHRIPCLGVEPAANVADVALAKGVPTRVSFFGSAVAKELAAEGAADLLIGNNVLAHVPHLNDFVAGLSIAVKPSGTVTMEFPHVLRLIDENQFDTIYHEHFSYFSLLTVSQVFAAHGLTIFDVEEIRTHGGSLRIFAARSGAPHAAVRQRVTELLGRERASGLDRLATYEAFDARAQATKRALLTFLARARDEGKRIVGYGAAAKGNTLLNYCGIRTDFLEYVVDRSPHKQGKYLPGTHIPIHAPGHILETRPDYVLILPWNLRDEVVRQMQAIRAWGGVFVVPIPRVEVL